MSDLNFIFIWSGKKQAKHSLPAVLHQQGGSVCLCCSLKVWFEWPPAPWLTPWKLVYLLQMNCCISNLPWGNSCWNFTVPRVWCCQQLPYPGTSAQAEATHLGSCFPGAQAHLRLWLASLGIFVCLVVRQGWHWLCLAAGVAWAHSTLLPTASSLWLAVPEPGMTQLLCKIPTEVSSAVP